MLDLPLPHVRDLLLLSGDDVLRQLPLHRVLAVLKFYLRHVDGALVDFRAVLGFHGR